MNETKVKPVAVATTRQKGRREAEVKSLAPVLLAVALVVVAAVIIFLTWAVGFYDGIYPNVTFAGINIGGMSKAEATTFVTEKYQFSRGDGVTLKFGDQAKKIEAGDVGALPVIDDIVESAYNVGRNGGVLERITTVVSSLFTKNQIEDGITPDEQKISGYVDAFADMVDKGQKAYDYRVDGDVLIVEIGSEGIAVDHAALKERVVHDFRNAAFESIDISEYAKVLPADALALDDLYDEIFVEAKDAELVYAEDFSYTISDEVTGVGFDLERAKERYENSEGELRIPLIYTYPEITAGDVDKLLFKDELAYVKTTLNANNINRTGNVRLSAAACNGKILAPGEIFSYNDTVGKRTYERGYKDASVYISTGIEDQLGGGICQTSSTIYMAVLRAQLEIVERYNHSYTVVYTPLGEDATVYWGSLDFRFSNNRNYPIKIEAYQEKDYIIVRIFGTKVDNNTFSIETDVHSSNPYATNEVENSALEYGVRKQKVEGHTGYSTTSYGVVKDEEGNIVERYKINSSRYKRLDRVIEVGTKNKPQEVTPTPTPTDQPAVPSDQPTQPPATPTPGETTPPAETPTPETPPPQETPTPEQPTETPQE